MTKTPGVQKPPARTAPIQYLPLGPKVFTEDSWSRIASRLQLSGRELQIVQAVFDDRTEASMAADLGISTHTVHTHVERLHHKLHVNSRVALVLRIVTEGLSLPVAPQPPHVPAERERAPA